MSDTVIAAQMYTVRQFTQKPADIAQTLAKVRAIGYQAIQISTFGPCDPDELVKMLKDNGLTVAAGHTRWQRFVEDLDKVIEEHQAWDCKHAVLNSAPYAYLNAEQIAEFARLAEDVGEKLTQAGLDFSYHNHDRELGRFGGKTVLELLYDDTDPHYLKAELDVYWIQAGGGDPAWWLRKYPGRCPVLHLKDMVVGPDGPRFAEVGEGNLNWPAILAAAKDAKVEWYCVEQDQCYERDPFDSLKISLDNLHKMGLK